MKVANYLKVAYLRDGPKNSGPIMVNNILTALKDKHDTAAVQPTSMASYPAPWYGLWVMVMFFGVSTWFLRNFTERVEATRLSALLGVVSMLTLLTWTLLEF